MRRDREALLPSRLVCTSCRWVQALRMELDVWIFSNLVKREEVQEDPMECVLICLGREDRSNSCLRHP